MSGTFDNFFQTEGNGQDSAEFIDFRKQMFLDAHGQAG